MEEDLKIELERAKMKNYILEKENEVLLGTIKLMARDKELLITEMESIKNSKSYKLVKRFVKLIRRN